MENNIYVLGIPTHSSLVESDLQNFVDQSTPTIYLHQIGNVNSPRQSYQGYNFLLENNFVDFSISNATEENEIPNKALVVCPISTSNGNVVSLYLAEKLLETIISFKTRFPNTRIAYITKGSPYTYDDRITRLSEVSSNYNVQVIDTRNFVDSDVDNFSKINSVLGFTNHLKPHFNDVYPPKDRSGIFFNNSEITIPQQLNTTKTFEQITDEAAQTYLNKDVCVAWSGGIDSTNIIAAFVKNNVPFKFTITEQARQENSELADYLVARYDYVEVVDLHNLVEVDQSYTIVTGDCADQLYPGIHHNFIAGGIQFKEIMRSNALSNYQTYLETPVESKYLKNNVQEVFVETYQKYFKCDQAVAESVYQEYLLPKIQQFPIEINHYYQLRWFFRFIFQYYVNSKAEMFRKFTNCTNDVVAFFDTEDYQRWAITNLDYNFDTYSYHYSQYKKFQKEYNYQVFGINSLLNQTKYPSM